MHPRLRHELLDRLVDARLVHLELSRVDSLNHSAESDGLRDLLRLEPDTSVEADGGLERDMRSKCG